MGKVTITAEEAIEAAKAMKVVKSMAAVMTTNMYATVDGAVGESGDVLAMYG